jgi:hypothetical protein
MPPQAARTLGPPKGADAPLNQSREALLAACLGAAALFRMGHGHRARPRHLTLWDFTEGAQPQAGPEELNRGSTSVTCC